jgi:hypothetical protein
MLVKYVLAQFLSALFITMKNTKLEDKIITVDAGLPNLQTLSEISGF